MLLKTHNDYIALPAKIAQQVLKSAEKNGYSAKDQFDYWLGEIYDWAGVNRVLIE